MKRYITSKGLHLTYIDGDRWVLEDAFGTCTLPFEAPDLGSAADRAYELAGVSLLGSVVDLGLEPNPECFWSYELERLYVSALTDHFRYWQVGTERVRILSALSSLLPIEYELFGFGEGSSDDLIELHKSVESAIEDNEVPYTKQLLAIRLSYLQLRRSCSDLMALARRSTRAFYELLVAQRSTIRIESRWFDLLSTPPSGLPRPNEIIHSGPKSYSVATNATTCIISLCSSLDISTKMIFFLNTCNRTGEKPKVASGKQFSDLNTLKSDALPQSVIDIALGCKQSKKELLSLIQLRHDLIHNTTALEMERIYVGHATPEINKLPLYYSYMPWRDCLENGQPVRCLGRDYFTSSRVDLECQIFTWIKSVMDYHIQIGNACLEFMKTSTVNDTGARLSRN